MRRFVFALCMLASVAAAAPPHYNGIPAYLQLEGIQGDVNVAGRENTIEVYDINWGLYVPSNPDDGTLTGGKVYSSFTFTKRLDKSSPILFNKLCTGMSIAKATFSFYEIDESGSEIKAYTIVLNNLKVSDITSFNPEGARVYPSQFEKVTFRYAGISFSDDVNRVTTKDGVTP